MHVIIKNFLEYKSNLIFNFKTTHLCLEMQCAINHQNCPHLNLKMEVKKTIDKCIQ